jgi:dienelactone hydrolase
MRFSSIAGAIMILALSTGDTPLRAASPLPPELQSNDVLLSAPRCYAAPGFEAPGVKALFYDGLPWKGKPTRVFAWYGEPQATPGQKLPAMVLVHGGGSTALSDWVRLWNRRGYAAIAMDTCGCVPRGKDSNWERHPDGGPPGWGGFDQVDAPPADQWPCHAAAAVVLAHSLIRTFPQVDADRIGLTGISWGGFLTCIVAGIDPRFRFAAPVYGCGFLGDNSCWSETLNKAPDDKGRKWLALWDPSIYLPHAAMPMLWVTGTNDFAFPMDSLQKSYLLPKAPHTLCVRVRMPHGHYGPGENPEEIRIFADNLLKSGDALPRITKQGVEANTVWAAYESTVPVARAEFTYTRDRGPWQQREWTTATLALDTAAARVSGPIPTGTAVWYINLFDALGAAASSEHQILDSSSTPPGPVTTE